MGRLVEVIGVPHDPTLPAAHKVRGGVIPEGAQRALEQFQFMRKRLDAARPDVIVMVAGDHLNQWFMNHMSPFVVGQASRMSGPFANELKAWSLETYGVPIDLTLAKSILHHGLEHGVDFAYSNEFVVDHAFTIPLSFLRPEQDKPVVPIFINLMAPPLPPGKRYYQVAETVRAAIEASPDNKRVAIITTGHMSNSVGGPNMLGHMQLPETEWDTKMWALIQSSSVVSILERSTWHQLYAAGNGTPGFFGYVFAIGAARGVPCTYSHMVATTAQPACAFLEWNETTLQEVTRGAL